MIRTILISLLFAMPTYAGETQTNNFRVFLRDFFNNPSFQMQHVKFPLEYTYYEAEFDIEEKSKLFSPENWKHLPGPDQFRCKINCFDLMIYDNFEKKQKSNGKRVLSFEGVENGILINMYFEYQASKWMLVRWEDYSG
jgi:hypothetical protein